MFIKSTHCDTKQTLYLHDASYITHLLLRAACRDNILRKGCRDQPPHVSESLHQAEVSQIDAFSMKGCQFTCDCRHGALLECYVTATKPTAIWQQTLLQPAMVTGGRHAGAAVPLHSPLTEITEDWQLRTRRGDERPWPLRKEHCTPATLLQIVPGLTPCRP